MRTKQHHEHFRSSFLNSFLKHFHLEALLFSFVYQVYQYNPRAFIALGCRLDGRKRCSTSGQQIYPNVFCGSYWIAHDLLNSPAKSANGGGRPVLRAFRATRAFSFINSFKTQRTLMIHKSHKIWFDVFRGRNGSPRLGEMGGFSLMGGLEVDDGGTWSLHNLTILLKPYNVRTKTEPEGISLHY